MPPGFAEPCRFGGGSWAYRGPLGAPGWRTGPRGGRHPGEEGERCERGGSGTGVPRAPTGTATTSTCARPPAGGCRT